MSSASPTSFQTPAERSIITSRSHSRSNPPGTTTPVFSEEPFFHPEHTIFDDDEETESFYVVLDITGDDFSSYGKYRNGRMFRQRPGGPAFGYDEDDDQMPPQQQQSDVEEEEDDEDWNGSNAAAPSGKKKRTGKQQQQRRQGRQKSASAEQEEDEEEDNENEEEDEEDGGSRDDGSSQADVDEGKSRASRRMQILDLDSDNPLVNYEGRIYTCKWAVSNGTEMIFSGPPDSDDEGKDERGSDFGGRKLKKKKEAKLVGTTVHRLEGGAAKIKARGRDKQAVAQHARRFAERMDAVLADRLDRMEKRGEDTSGWVMKRFSEGQGAFAVA